VIAAVEEIVKNNQQMSSHRKNEFERRIIKSENCKLFND